MASKLLPLVALAAAVANAQSGPYAQCGGIGWSGSTTCVSGWHCVKLNDWYSQCLEGSGPAPTSTQQPPVTTEPPVSTSNPPVTSQPPATTTSNAPAGPTGSASPNGLHGRFGTKNNRYFGNILDSNTLNDNAVQSILTSDFGVITAENSMKWDATEPNRGQFNFGNADNVANWATSRGKLIRGHTLVWHSQLPGWVSNIGDSNTLTSVIQNHINQVAGRYKGKVYHWDVCNEVFEDNGTWRNSVFYRVLGENFVDVAFRAARAIDPAAKLYINDYNLDYAGPKLEATVSLIGRLKGRGTPIDGVGTQAHLIAGNLNNFQGTLERLASTGLEVAITELDIRIPKPVDSSKLAQQARDYETVTKACLNVPACVGISIWGVTDRQSWVDGTFPNDDAPLLWDDNVNKKSAYDAVMNAIGSSSGTTSAPPGSTSAPPVTTTSQPPATTTRTGPTGSASATGLHGLIGKKGGRYYGNIVDSNTMNDGSVQNILNAEFGVITAENSMKWDATEPNRGQFNWGGADNVANWATSRGKLIRGHTLVWHSQLPGWVSNIGDSNTLTSVIQNHVNQVAGRYKGKVYHWDVCNEVFEDNGTWRNSVFYRVLGENFVDVAFRAARAIDPAAKLYINDYNLDYAGPKLEAMVSLIGRLKGRGTPIDGVGTQAHLIAGNLNNFQGTLERLASTGLEVAITELDIRIPKSVTSAKLTQQQRDYETVTKACLNVPACVGITIWGVSDRHSWVDSTFPNDDSPLLWDDNYGRKSAYTGVTSAINSS